MNRLAIVFLYLFVSCSPESAENNLNPTISDKLLSSVTATFSDYVFETEYEYDVNDNLLTISVDQLAGYTSIFGFTYENNLPTKQFPIYQQALSPYHQIEYEDNLISEIIYVDPSSNATLSKWEYIYDNDILIECKHTRDNNSDGILEQIGSLTIEYQNNKIYKINLWDGSFRIFEYDDKFNMLYNMNNYQLMQQVQVKDLGLQNSISDNNITSVSLYYPDGTLYKQHIWIYEYDSDDFPTSVIKTTNDGETPIFFELHYQ